MQKTLGSFKGILMLVLLMLIATRLTWLQTSDNEGDLSSTFYRTGLWFNEHVAKKCVEPPEATFPLPPAMAVRPDAQPPPPALGELSPGLVAVMYLKCRWERLETENLAHWNAWLFMGATLFSAIAVRIFTNSWTAGLLAAVAVLSRGTLQNRSTLAAAEPFAAPFIAASWCFSLAFLRSLWRPWLIGTFGCWIGATLFVPSLWISMASLSLAPLLAIRPGAPKEICWTSGPLDRAIYERIAATFPNKVWLYITGLGLLGTALYALIILRLLPGSIPIVGIIKNLLTDFRSWHGLVNSFQSFAEIIYLHSPDVDWHAWVTLLLIGVQPFTGGTFGPLNRAAAVCFGAICLTQIGISVVSESYFIYTTTQAHPSIFPSARSMEPIFIAWGTGSAWRILDVFTGYRLSSSGWSIRGRDRINRP